MSLNLKAIEARGILVVGDIDYRNKKCPTEGAEQITFFNTLRDQFPALAAVAVHPKNEGRRHGAQVNADRMMGSLNTGASDVIIPGFPTLIIELKRQDRTLSDITTDQLDYLAAAQDLDCWVCVALGWQAAIDMVQKWLDENY